MFINNIKEFKMKYYFYITTITLIFVIFNIVEAQDNKTDKLIASNYAAQDTASTELLETENEFKSPETNPIPDDIRQRCSEFYNSLMNETVSEAYNNLFRGSPISRNQDKIRNLVVSTTKAIEIYGKLYGYEAVGINKISPSFSIVKYFSLHSLNPIEWTITFYKSPTIGWIVLNFKFSDTF